jgi:hypothetical protein
VCTPEDHRLNLIHPKDITFWKELPKVLSGVTFKKEHCDYEMVSPFI